MLRNIKIILIAVGKGFVKGYRDAQNGIPFEPKKTAAGRWADAVCQTVAAGIIFSIASYSMPQVIANVEKVADEKSVKFK